MLTKWLLWTNQEIIMHPCTNKGIIHLNIMSLLITASFNILYFWSLMYCLFLLCVSGVYSSVSHYIKTLSTCCHRRRFSQIKQNNSETSVWQLVSLFVVNVLLTCSNTFCQAETSYFHISFWKLMHYSLQILILKYQKLQINKLVTRCDSVHLSF